MACKLHMKLWSAGELEAHMRLLRGLAALMAVFFSGSASPATGSTRPPSGMVIQVKNGDWGATRTDDIEATLRSVADALLPYFPQRTTERIQVRFSRQGPRVLSEKSSDGAYVVLLNVQDRRWDQFAYQFSHELCHMFSNFESRETGHGGNTRDHQWFEETLCEAVSIFTLKQVGSSWERSAPHPQWKSYAPAFLAYAEQLLSENHRRLPADQSIEDWFSQNREALTKNPYLREKNETLAISLLPLLENTGGSLQSIGYLNLGHPSVNNDKSFETFLETWYSCCPEENREFVSRILSLLAIHGKPAPVAGLMH